MSELWEKIKKPFMWVIGALALILTIFRLRDKAAYLDAKEALLDTDKESTRLDSKVEGNQDKAKAAEDVAKANQDAAASKTADEVEDFYKGRK